MRAADVDGGHFSDLAFGGLNHQIEHHLFTSMPSPDLRKARTIVRQYCRELGGGCGAQRPPSAPASGEMRARGCGRRVGIGVAAVQPGRGGGGAHRPSGKDACDLNGMIR
ncbi:fatty acid desaturase [Streptomyces tendae]